VSSPARCRASVLIPTHDHYHTLDLAVGSALRQTVQEIEVLIVGDGVTAELREVALRLENQDERVRFLDLPKGPHHGEPHRDAVIRQATSDVICYLCDDDLLLPEHVADMVALLAEADLANSLNGHLSADGRFIPYPSDLASAEYRVWSRHPTRNAVSVTGTAHTVEAYLRLPVGWEVPPSGWDPDHYLWQKFLDDPALRSVTSSRVTALQFPSHVDGRSAWTGDQRRAELLQWSEVLVEPVAAARFEVDTHEAFARAMAFNQYVMDFRLDVISDRELLISEFQKYMVNYEAQVRHPEVAAAETAVFLERVRAARYEAEAETLRRQLEELGTRHHDMVGALSALDARHKMVANQLGAIEGTRSWRVRTAMLRLAPVRALARLTRRRPTAPGETAL